MICDGKEYEHTKIVIEGNKEIWFRRRVDQEKKAEIITEDPETVECLKRLAAEYPDVIEELTENEDERFHALLGSELIIEYTPVSGLLAFWVQKYEEVPEDEK